MNIVIAPVSTGEPRKAPASYSSRASIAVMVPSDFAPTFSHTRVAAPGPVARNTSSRDICIFTGRPHLRDSATASGSR